MQLLKQSTAINLTIGPFVDDADGVTPLTELVIQKADVRLAKNGATLVTANADQGESDEGAGYDELGYYIIDLNTTDTGSLGLLKVAVNKSGALPVWQDYMVVPANVYDSLVLGTDYLQADTVQINGAAATSPPTVAAIRTELDDNSTKLAAIVADTNELQTDWVNGGRLDLLIDALGSAATAIKAVTDLLPDAGALTTIGTNAATAATQSTTAATQATTAATQATNALKKNTAYTVTTENGELETTFSE